MPRCTPDFETFAALASAVPPPGSPPEAVRLVPVCRELFSDTLTPVTAYRRLVAPDDRDAPSFLYESVLGGDRVGRYSFLGAQPIEELLAYRDRVTHRIHEHIAGRPPVGSRDYDCPDPLAELDRILAGFRASPLPGGPSFTGGWVGYAGYDVVRYLEGEKLPDPPQDDRGLPDLHFQLYRDLVAFDHVHKTIRLITHAEIPRAEAGRAVSLRAAYDAAEARLGRIDQRLRSPSAMETHAEGHVDLASPPRALRVSSLGEGGYQRAVEIIKRYIAAGDAFQVVPSQRFEIETAVDPFDVYRALRVVNPSPYMFYLQAEGAKLIGSSPEILVHVEASRAGPEAGGKTIVNRPLAGTRKRGATPQEDAALEEELLADPKDVAEHVMLVDLGRNDVGRVAEPGTIALPAVLQVERYSHVMHLSSTVTGRLREGLTAWDALRVTLPVGTVSGAPKVRAMQIIDEVEATRRGPYAGAVGYADFAGDMDMCIALRTMVAMRAGLRGDEGRARRRSPPGPAGWGPSRGPVARWVIHLQAGGGIVADSDPDAEHQETVNKAAALAKAIDLAEQAFTGGSSRRGNTDSAGPW